MHVACSRVSMSFSMSDAMSLIVSGGGSNANLVYRGCHVIFRAIDTPASRPSVGPSVAGAVHPGL